MLEIKNIVKIYRSKTGEEVRALDGVSIQFPESGMVFLLGKSGSGKSTLLNVIGGLDSYDEGEFSIMGKSSKDFVGSDFDAYRNTFIGFIFQEYNVLDDFTVGANIGLALELQGKKATGEAIEEILAKVDLVGYAHRKPNELSGGQKQRVAIARALVKEPQIIMADEPTGALDSNTGKQIFDTLKALSKDKLVLVVSHDRDFAEKYADRIIELSDGRIIDDVTKHEHQSERISDGVHRINDHILRIERGYQLTARDLEMINAYLAGNTGDVLLSGDRRVNDELRSAAGISEDGGTSVFEGTKPEKDVKLKSYEAGKTKFIRSRLPMKNAVKMGASSLKHKTVRLVFTIILSLVAFGMFGLADTLAAYNKITAATESILKSEQKTASFALFVRESYRYDDEVRAYYNTTDAFNQQDIADLKEKTGLDFLPVYTGSTGSGKISFYSHFLDSNKPSHSAYNGAFSGFVSLSEAQLSNYGLSLIAGTMPDAENEIVITKHIYDQFKYYGFKGSANVSDDNLNMNAQDANSIIGKTLSLQIGSSHAAYVIVGVVESNFPAAQYADFLPNTGEGGGTVTTDKNDTMLMFKEMELQTVLNYDIHCLGITTEQTIETLSDSFERNYRNVGTHLNGMEMRIESVKAGGSGSAKNIYVGGVQLGGNIIISGNASLGHISMVANSSAISALKITWLDGTPRTTLGEKEVVISSYVLRQILDSADLSPDFAALEQYAANRWAHFSTDSEIGIAQRITEAIQQASDKDAEYLAILDTLLSTLYVQIEKGELSEDQQVKLARDIIELLGRPAKHSSGSIQELRAHIYSYYDVYKNDYALIKNADFRNDMQLIADEWFQGQSVEDAYNWDAVTSDAEKASVYNDLYYEYLTNNRWKGYDSNDYGSWSGQQLQAEKEAIWMSLTHLDWSDLGSLVVFRALSHDWDSNGNQQTKDFAQYTDWKIVGYHDSEDYLMISNDFYNVYCDFAIAEGYSVWEYAFHESGIYSHVLAPMPTDAATLEKLVTLSYDEGGDVAFKMQNSIMNTLETFNEFAEPGAKIFLFVGLGFAVFAALLLMNFIATSITYKKREIGILRAVGARSSDVFKIFFSESAIIALINFVLATIAVIVAIFFLNRWMINSGIQISLLNFGIRQIALMLGVSVLVAVLASFFPVYRIAKKKPVDAIKDR